MKVHGQSDLLRRQNAERLAAERDMMAAEQETLERFVSEDEEKRNRIIDEMSDKLANKLQGMPSECSAIFKSILRWARITSCIWVL